MFNHMARLKLLHLHNNKLIMLSVWQINPTVTEITLSYNPWSCDCEYTEMFREWMKRVNSITDISSVKCIYSKGNNTEMTVYNEDIFNDSESDSQLQAKMEQFAQAYQVLTTASMEI